MSWFSVCVAITKATGTSIWSGFSATGDSILCASELAFTVCLIFLRLLCSDDIWEEKDL